jgi:hypothetical protein
VGLLPEGKERLGLGLCGDNTTAEGSGWIDICCTLCNEKKTIEIRSRPKLTLECRTGLNTNGALEQDQGI